MISIQVLRDLFKKYFDGEPSLIVRAPGRINIIGDHTDYNDGFVLPMAIDRSVWIACRSRGDDRVICHSKAFKKPLQFSLGRFWRKVGHWGEYIKGVGWALLRAGHRLAGWEGVVLGDIPIGAGLSSSAAIEIAALLVFSEISNIPWKPVEMAKMGQLAETDWVGVDSGIMDQMISALAEPGTALLLDCRSLLTQKIAVPPELAIFALDSGIRRDLVTSTYNQRHQECAMAAKELGVKALRDLNYDEFRRVSHQLSDTLRKRAHHVITENERTLLGAKALQGGEMTKLGELIDESHESLRDDFEVSSFELDTLTDIARSMEGCFGARMTGAGFGGFALALVELDSQGDFIERVTREYKDFTDFETVAELCEPAKGAEVVYSR